MNLHALAASQVGTVNQHVPLTVRVSTGRVVNDAAFKPVPEYATPGLVVADFVGGLMSVTAQSAGFLMPGQQVSGAGVKPGTVILRQLSGTPGGLGAYEVNLLQDELYGVTVGTTFVVKGQVQPVSFKDLQQLEGLNLQGTQNTIYLYGQVDAIVRPDNKGGDLISDPAGRSWLVVKVIEAWVYSGWCSVAATLQNTP